MLLDHLFAAEDAARPRSRSAHAPRVYQGRKALQLIGGPSELSRSKAQRVLGIDENEFRENQLELEARATQQPASTALPTAARKARVMLGEVDSDTKLQRLLGVEAAELRVARLDAFSSQRPRRAMSGLDRRQAEKALWVLEGRDAHEWKLRKWLGMDDAELAEARLAQTRRAEAADAPAMAENRQLAELTERRPRRTTSSEWRNYRGSRKARQLVGEDVSRGKLARVLGEDSETVESALADRPPEAQLTPRTARQHLKLRTVLGVADEATLQDAMREVEVAPAAAPAQGWVAWVLLLLLLLVVVAAVSATADAWLRVGRQAAQAACEAEYGLPTHMCGGAKTDSRS